MKWASTSFIQAALDFLEKENFLVKENSLYKNANIKEDFSKNLEELFLKRLLEEDLAPTAPYNIYDELDLDRKLGDNILKALTAKKQVVRLQHNIFIHAQSLNNAIKQMREIITNDGFIEIANFKEKFSLSRKYIVTYLDYLDNFSDIRKDGNRRVFI